MDKNHQTSKSEESFKLCCEIIGQANFANLYGIELVEGYDNTVIDADGNKYLDFLSGASCCLLGYRGV